MAKVLSSLKKYIQRKLGISQLIVQQQSFAEKQAFLAACQRETLKANLFRDTIQDSEWLKYKSFSPGGWAADYGVLYTLYRVLNDVKPKNIIEFGLGQTSKMLHQYGAFFKNTKVITCEHSSEWIDFFKAQVGDKYPLNIQLLELEYLMHQGAETIAYKGLDGLCKGEKFDLILVDGPYGTEHFSRNQLVGLVRDNLAEHFCIIMDDYERVGEQETIEEVMGVLDSQKVPYSQVVYEASKKHCLICSKEVEFLTTLYWF